MNDQKDVAVTIPFETLKKASGGYYDVLDGFKWHPYDGVSPDPDTRPRKE